MTGRPMMSRSSRVTCVENFANDSSLTSNSRLAVKRAKNLVVAEVQPGVVDAFRLTRPMRKSRKWS